MIKKTIFILLILLGIYWVVQYMTAQPAALPEKKADVIIVLGISMNKDNKPNVFMKQRLDKAIDLFRKSYSDKMLLTGAPVSDEISEAKIMLAYCLENGIPREAIILEPNARNTRENAKRSFELMNSHSLQSAIVVTTPSHIPRSKILFSKYLTDLQMAPADNTFLTFILSKPMATYEKIMVRRLEKEADLN